MPSAADQQFPPTYMHVQKFIAAFTHLNKLKVSCVYEPFAPLQLARPGQVDSLKITLDKKVTDAFLERLSNSMRAKRLKGVTMLTVFKCSAFLASESLNGVLDGNALEKLVLRNMRGYSPLSLLRKIAALPTAEAKGLRQLVFENLNLNQSFSEELLQLLRQPSHPSLFTGLEKLMLAPLRVEKSSAGESLIDEIKTLVEARSHVGSLVKSNDVPIFSISLEEDESDNESSGNGY